MKSYAQLLSEKLKKAGRDCVQSRKADRVEVLHNNIEELMKDAIMTGTFWTWMEAVTSGDGYYKISAEYQQSGTVSAGDMAGI